MESTTVVKDFQEEIKEMNEDDARLKTIKELDDIKRKERVFDHLWDREEQQTVLGLLKGRKEKKKKDLGIRNYPDSCIEKMDENDIRLKTIKEWKKSMEKKDRDGIRNYPESCMERMLSDEQVHGI